MTPFELVPTKPTANYFSSCIILLSKGAPVFFYLFLFVTTLAVFIPLNPKMPASGLDASWEFAMNQAVRQHLTFGRQVVFTWGPYASVGTWLYDPATNARMMCGSLLLALSYVTALLFLSSGEKRYLIVVLLLVLATFGAPEQLLLSYSLLLVVCTLQYINSQDRGKIPNARWWHVLAVFVMWSTLGLLPVVKGTLLLPFALSVAIPPCLLFYCARYRQGLLLLFLPLASAVALWTIAGQPLATIPAFLRGNIALTTGYTEAMSTSWAVLPGVVGDGLVAAFITLSLLLCTLIVRARVLTLLSKVIVILFSAALLLIAFKHGFVATAAIASSFTSLAVVILIVALFYVDRYLMWLLTVTIFITSVTAALREPILTQEVHARFGVGAAWTGGGRRDILAYCLNKAAGAYWRVLYRSTWNTYATAWHGFRLRASAGNDLDDQFEEAKSSISAGYDLPALGGTVDVYDYEQSIVLASSNIWDPRPVLQSYSAYTPLLARLDEEHLRGKDAPNWVLFDLQSIDGRLPSLDDGVSWPALLDNYTFRSYDGRFVLLRKNLLSRPSSTYDYVFQKTYKTGSTVTLPDVDGLLFAEVELKPTLAGRALIALFNPPQLHIVLGLANGKTETYRVISGMMRTDFLLSPAVGSTGDFSSLMARTSRSLSEERVKTISITPLYGGSMWWSDTYELKLKRYAGL